MPTSKSTRSPAFQFYPGDFLSSSKVQRMSLTEMGAYLKLLCLNWLDGSLPDDVAILASMVGLKQPQFAKMWAGPLHECFEVRGGRLVNPRLEKERKAQAEFRKKQKDKADIRWDKHRNTTIGNATALPERHPRGNALQSSSSSSSTQKPKEQVSESAEPDSGSPPLLVFPTIGTGGSTWALTESLVASWREAYPGLDVLGECRHAKAWVEAQPARRKTAVGMSKFLVNWFNRTVERGSRAVAGTTGTNGKGRTGAPPAGKYDGLEERD